MNANANFFVCVIDILSCSSILVHFHITSLSWILNRPIIIIIAHNLGYSRSIQLVTQLLLSLPVWMLISLLHIALQLTHLSPLVSCRVFVNRSLAMEKIKCFGFDMDYTLAGKLDTHSPYLSALVLKQNSGFFSKLIFL